jgi:hypothetical protein
MVAAAGSGQSPHFLFASTKGDFMRCSSLQQNGDNRHFKKLEFHRFSK